VAILRPDQVEHFIANGYAHLEAAFPSDLARRCVDELRPATGLDRDSPDRWVEPVIRVEGSAAPPLVAAINAPRLVGAIDDLLGAGRWQRRTGYATFPSASPPSVTPATPAGTSTAPTRPVTGRRRGTTHLNCWSRGRALLLLMLCSDVGPDVHAATWPHRGLTPRFLGQPAILHAGDRDGFDYDRDDRGAPEIAVRRAVSTG
jgi:hypothetical protein